MAKLGGFMLLFLIVLLLGGTALLAIWDIPPPTATIEQRLPDSQFPK